MHREFADCDVYVERISELHERPNRRELVHNAVAMMSEGSVLGITSMVFYPSPFLPLVLECGQEFDFTPPTADALPTESAIASWLHKDGMKHIFISQDRADEDLSRKLFFATNNEKAAVMLRGREDLFEVDEEYWAIVNQTLAASLKPIEQQ